MSDQKLKTTTSHTFSLTPSEAPEKKEELDQSCTSHFDESLERPDNEDGTRKKKKKKKKKKKRAKDTNVELQSYVQDSSHWDIPSAAVYETPASEPMAAASSHASEGSTQWKSPGKMPVSVQKQEEKRGLHRQTSIVTVSLGSVAEPEKSVIEALAPVEPDSCKEESPVEIHDLPYLATRATQDERQEESRKKTSEVRSTDTKAEGTQGGAFGGYRTPEVVESDVNGSNTPRSDKRAGEVVSIAAVGKAIKEKSREVALKEGTSKEATSKEGVSKETTLKAGTSKEATSKEGTSKETTSKEAGKTSTSAVKPGPSGATASVDMSVVPSTSGGASQQPPPEQEPEAMCCGIKVDPDGCLGQTINKHKSLGRCRPAGGPFPAMYRGLKRLCGKLKEKLIERKWLFGVIIGVLLLVMFVILFPVSLVRLDYHEVALKRTKSTQKIHRDQVYYAGCYVLGPNTEFVTYSRSVHMEEIYEIGIFTSDRLEVTLDVVFHYFIRPEELGSLNAKYGVSYKPILTNIAVSTIKNTFVNFSLDQLIRARQEVEMDIHRAVQRKLGGTCCMSCCTSEEGCNSDRLVFLCDGCDSSESCGQGHHMDVRHFHFGRLVIPDVVSSRLMASVLAEVYAGRESLVRDKVIIEKESERRVEEIHNEASEITGSAAANASLITWLARTEGYEVTVQNATLHGWNHMNTRLGIDDVEDYKLSLFMVSNLDKMDNLVMAQDYREKTNVQG